MSSSSNSTKRLQTTRGRCRATAALVLALLLGTAIAEADELVYRPVSPSFGGNPLNGNFLLATAEGQRPKRPESRQSALDRFSETIQASLLNRIAQKVADAILGENAQDRGSFTVGDTSINFERQGDQVEIVVTSPKGSVTLEVPVASFL